MKKCKPTEAAVVMRMRAAERLNNRNGGTYYTNGGPVFPIELFGISNPSKSGAFTIKDIIEELK